MGKFSIIPNVIYPLLTGIYGGETGKQACTGRSVKLGVYAWKIGLGRFFGYVSIDDYRLYLVLVSVVRSIFFCRYDGEFFDMQRGKFSF